MPKKHRRKIWFQRSLNPIFESSEPKNCRQEQVILLVPSEGPWNCRVSSVSTRCRCRVGNKWNSEAAGRDIWEGSEHAKERKRNFFFLPFAPASRLHQNKRAERTNLPIFILQQDRPLPQNNLRIQYPKTKENRRENHLFIFLWFFTATPRGLETLRPAPRSNFRPPKLRMNK